MMNVTRFLVGGAGQSPAAGRAVIARLYLDFTVFARYRQSHVDGPGGTVPLDRRSDHSAPRARGDHQLHGGVAPTWSSLPRRALDSIS